MSKVINLYGGPGTGKSTTAAKTFALMKESGENVELVTEWVKKWAWEGKTPVTYDQFYIFGKQAHKEYTLFDKVDHIITDSPVVLCGMYTQLYGTPAQAALFRSMILTYLDMVKSCNQEYVHVFLKRVKAYNPAGRYQTEEQAKGIDEVVRRYLTELGIPFHTVKADQNAHIEIVKLLQ